MNGKEALDVLKSFKEIMSAEDYTEFLKSEDSEKLRAFPEVQEFLKAESGEELEKGESGEELEKGEGEKEEKGEKENEEEEEEEKGEKDELIKGLTNQLNESNTRQTELAGKVESLEKSISTLTDAFQQFSGMSLGTKAVKTGNANFFEKAFAGEEQKDDGGKTILSTTVHKGEILKAMENGLDKSEDPGLIKSYEDSIIRYNAGNGTISKEVAMDLYEKHNIRLVQ